MKKIFVVILVAISCHSCITLGFVYNTFNSAAPAYVKSGITCYSLKDTSIDSLININGYYEGMTVTEINDSLVFTNNSIKYLQRKTTLKDTGSYNIVFFNDGICAANFMIAVYDDNNDNAEQNVNRIKYNDSVKNYYYVVPFWGKYDLFTDTIKMQCIAKPYFGGAPTPWFGFEAWYKVIDKATIQLIYKKPICRKSEMQSYSQRYEDTFYYPAKFIQAEMQPPVDCWLKKKKWFWCNKEDWKKHKEKMKKK